MNRSLLANLAVAVTMGVPAVATADLKVVTTTSDLAAIVEAIGGEHVDVTAMALPTQDPHFVDARPHLALALSRADLLVAIGLGLEVGWLPTLQTGSRNGEIQSGGRGFLDASRHVRPLEVPAGRVDRSQGDIHPGGSPHFMFDPRRVAEVARAIGARMAQLDGSNADAYRAGTERFVTALERARARWERQLAGLRGANVIAYHKSFGYLADWLGFRVVEHIEPRPGIPPNPHHVAHVLGAARQHGVRVILQESFYPETTSDLIAQRTSARLVRIPGGPDVRRGESYVDFMDGVVRMLVGAAR
jgi:zinc/manganese transport system substrate-binding protein